MVLQSYGDRKIAVIKAVRAATGLGLKEAKALVDSARLSRPQTVKSGVSKEIAALIVKSLEDAGGYVGIVDSSGTIQRACTECATLQDATNKFCEDCGRETNFWLLVDTPPPPPVRVAQPDNRVAQPATKAESFRMPIDDIFSITGRGTVACGTITNGTLSAGDQVVIEGGTLTTTVIDIQINRRSCDSASKGDAVGLLLRGVKRRDLHKGQVLVPIVACPVCNHMGSATDRFCKGCGSPTAHTKAQNSQKLEKEASFYRNKGAQAKREREQAETANANVKSAKKEAVRKCEAIGKRAMGKCPVCARKMTGRDLRNHVLTHFK